MSQCGYYVNQPWRFKRVLDGRRIQDAGREDSDTLDTFDATDLRNIDPGKHTLCAPANFSARPSVECFIGWFIHWGLPDPKTNSVHGSMT